MEALQSVAGSPRARRLRGHVADLAPEILAAGLLSGLAILWAAHDGGYDADTWYWGALVLLAVLAALTFTARTGSVPRTGTIALGAFAAYVAWSYLSISWAGAPGVALTGSNRALLYLIVFALGQRIRWRERLAELTLLTFALGIGTIALVILVRLAAGDGIGVLITDGRLTSPTGYFNATVALFTMGALVAIVLAAQRRLPGPLRGLLSAMAAAELQLAIAGQSRGWLFTLPLVVLVVVAITPGRLRLVLAAAVPALAALIPVHRLLAVYDHSGQASKLRTDAIHAGHPALLLVAGTFFVATLIAWADGLLTVPLSVRARRWIGTGLATAALVLAGAGGVAATHGHPFRFISRQWSGFSHQAVYSPTSGSHFATLGSGRYDFWRVSLDAFASHPIGGLGQDNFVDYYLPRRHTDEEPSWTHSLEMRLLAHTGIVGFALFAAFLVAALLAAGRMIRGGDPAQRAVAAAALLPAVVWLIHGSVDWFWEVPALSAPALGFMGMAGALGPEGRPETWPQVAAGATGRNGYQRGRNLRRVLRPAALGVGLVAAVVALGFPYLSVRDVSKASDLSSQRPLAALQDLQLAGQLNPLSVDPGSLGGSIALRNGLPNVALPRFDQATSREPGAWFSWLGAGLAASDLGDVAEARRDYRQAEAINSRQPVVRRALARVDTTHPLTPKQAFDLLTLVH